MPCIIQSSITCLNVNIPAYCKGLVNQCSNSAKFDGIAVTGGWWLGVLFSTLYDLRRLGGFCILKNMA